MRDLTLYKPGDVLVQNEGWPWTWGAQLVTGEPFPHAALVHDVGPVNVWIVENSYDGVKVKPCPNLAQYEIWRPRCPDEVKQHAIAWALEHVGESYGYARLAELVFGYRAGLRTRPGMDDDYSQDGRLKVCSELIAMAYYRSAFDLVPNVQDRDTLPKDLRNAVCLERIYPLPVV